MTAVALGLEVKVVPVPVEEAAVTLAAQVTAAALGAAVEAKVRTLVALQSSGIEGCTVWCTVQWQ